MMAERRGRFFALAVALPPLAALTAFFLLPWIAALSAGFRGGGGIHLPPALFPLVLFTLKQAFFSTLLALALGLPGAWLAGGDRRPLLRALTGIPFAMPPVLVTLAFALFFGRSGWLNRLFMAITGSGPLNILYRPSAVILAHGFYNFPLVVRIAGDGIAKARRSWSQAASSLGARPLAGALTVVLPASLPSILAGALLVFLYSFTSFAVALVLGGGPAASTLAVEIYRHARVSLDFSTAGFLALTETLLALLVFLLYLACEKFQAQGEGLENIPESGQKGKSPPGGFLRLSPGGAAYLLLLTVLVFLPLAAIPAQSFLARARGSPAPRFSLINYLNILPRALPALGRSAALAFFSATVSSIIAVLFAAAAHFSGNNNLLSRLIRLSAALPLVSSGVVLGLGYGILYGRGGSFSVLSLALFHAVSALPFAFSSVYQGYRDAPPRILDAAASLGAGPAKRLLTVQLPLAAARLRSAWAFSAALSMGELNGILMLGGEKFETLPLLVYRAAGAYRHGEACAAGSLLILCFAVFFLLSGLPGNGRRDGP